jgi:hypothetical protein
VSRTKRVALVVVLGVLAVPALVAAAPDGSANVRFGNEGTGSPFPPPDHDRSFNAYDSLVPRTVVISRGGSVTYAMQGFHQPAVYEPGTTPADIEILGPEPWVNDPDGRVALGPLNVPPATTSWTTPPGTFAAPGRYLVLCNFMPHFAFASMYGWVEVK